MNSERELQRAAPFKDQRAAVERAAWSAPGVRSAEDDLQVEV